MATTQDTPKDSQSTKTNTRGSTGDCLADDVTFDDVSKAYDEYKDMYATFDSLDELEEVAYGNGAGIGGNYSPAVTQLIQMFAATDAQIQTGRG